MSRVRTEAGEVLGGGHPHFRRILGNSFYSGHGLTSRAFTVAGRVFISPIDLPFRATVDRIAYIVGATAAGNVRVGLYEIGSTGWPDLPDGGAVLAETLSLPQVAAGRVQYVTIPPLQLEENTYYIAVQGDNTGGTFYSWSVDIWQHNADGLVRPARTYDRAGGYGQFTDPCPATTAASFPSVYMRIASIP